MGCDGGTIPRRDELVRVKKKSEVKDKESELSFLWQHCFITQERLQSPIVMCGLGKLYNKMSIIELLLNKDKMPITVKHIRSLKDIKNVNLTPNPAYKEGTDIVTTPHICPVTGIEMSGKYRFVALWTCGCVFSERAFKEIGTRNCHKCQKPFEDKDVVILNGNENDIILMKQNLEVRQQRKKNKEKKPNVEVASTSSSAVNEIASCSKEQVEPKNNTEENVVSTSCKQNQKSAVKRQGLLKPSTIDAKKMKADYSVAKDPKVTDVYKSIFTTHASEQKQNRAHWVTYNPFYN